MKHAVRIGSVQLDHPFVLAPLAGITDSSFRRLCKEQGAALVYSEMISAKGLYYNEGASHRLLSFLPEETPIGYQLFGSDPWFMGWAVERLADRGNALLDINMGCPVPKVVKNGDGAALMRDPEKAAAIVRKMVGEEEKAAEKRGRTPRPITVKCRLGWDTSQINIDEFSLRMEEAGAAALAIHARTRDQFYSGSADWEAIARIKGKLHIPVIGSGDVLTADDGVAMLRQTRCDLVMIARGALGNPWIFRDAVARYRGGPVPDPPTIHEKVKMILAHLALSTQEKGEYVAIREMRKHAGWYLKGVPKAAALRHKLNRATDKKELETLLIQELGISVLS